MRPSYHFRRLAASTVAIPLLAACLSHPGPSPESTEAVTSAAAKPVQDPPVEASLTEQQSLEISSPAPAEGAVAPAPPLAQVARDSDLKATAAARPAASSAADAGAPVSSPGTRRYSLPLPPPVFPERDHFLHRNANAIERVADQPVSTFSADVDTASYANLRRSLQHGAMPPADAVRVEEMINYFDYAYSPPAGPSPTVPFALHTELAPTPWNSRTVLMRVGLKGEERAAALPTANLVFLVDVSGSMADADKLPLLKASLKLLTRSLRQEDRISLVVYAGSSGIVLEPTSGAEVGRIDVAIERLSAGGSTNGGAGIRLAYRVARQSFVEGGINRILLCTDGDFNVGATHFEALRGLVERERETGVSLSTLGFGAGNFNDALMQQLADAGDGNYNFIDSLTEAQKVLVEQRAGTLLTIAKDLKIQVEFNPAVVSEYRLIGYEKRALGREEFGDDRVDAGDVGAGHAVTALYELTLAGSGGARIDALRYGEPAAESSLAGEVAFVRLRFKSPNGYQSQLVERPVRRSELLPDLARASESMRWATAVAAFGQALTGGRYLQGFGYDRILRLAESSHGYDPQGDRGEMLRLIGLAESLSPNPAALNAREPAPRPDWID